MTIHDENIEEQQDESREDKVEDNIFAIDEIVIEEMAIDGICGVY